VGINLFSWKRILPYGHFTGRPEYFLGIRTSSPEQKLLIGNLSRNIKNQKLSSSGRRTSALLLDK
jgi:hypothetical protein